MISEHKADRNYSVYDRPLAIAASGVLISTILYALYLFTHPYPHGFAGLYLQMAEGIQSNGFLIPERVTNYTPGGLPFVYPPFAFYVLAVIQELSGSNYLSIVTVLPGLIYVSSAVPAAYLFNEIHDGRLGTWLSTVLFVSNPVLLTIVFGANGITRAIAMTATLGGLFFAWKIYVSKTYSTYTILGAGLSFGVVAITHPSYTLFYVIAVLTLFFVKDRTLKGLFTGSAIAGLGLLVTLSWLVQVVPQHGFAPFFAASSTGGGIVTPLKIAKLFGASTFPELSGGTLFLLTLPVIGSLLLVWRKEYHLPVLAVVSLFFHGQEWVYAFTIPLAVIAITDVILPNLTSQTERPKLCAISVIVLVISLQLVPAALFSTNVSVSGGAGETPSQLAYSDTQAIDWVKDHTATDSTFVVVGESSEWFGFLANRTSVVSPQGSEWLGKEANTRQWEIYNQLESCLLPACYVQVLRIYQVDADYLYLRKSSFLREVDVPGSSTERLFAESSSFSLEYENENVIIYEITAQGLGNATSRSLPSRPQLSLPS